MTASLLRRYGSDETPQQRKWFDVADQVAGKLAQDAGERDAANQPPFAELDLLKGSGLLPLMVPKQFGGEGIDWLTAFEIVQRIARADNSIGQLVGYHYSLQSFIFADASDEIARRFAAESLEQQLLVGSSGTPQGDQLKAAKVDGGYIFSGTKPFSTGSRVADRLTGRAVTADGQRIAAVVDTGCDGIIRHDDWDVLGSRLTATNTVEFRDVFVPDEWVLVAAPAQAAPEGRQSLFGPIAQLTFAVVYLASAEGAVEAARAYTQTSSRKWFHAAAEQPVDDPFIQNNYGEFVARLQALAAVVEHATMALQWAWDQDRELAAADRAGVAEQVAAAKVNAHYIALDVTSRIYDVMGARSAANKYGFDRYWRDVRTHTLHDPVAYKLNELGRFYLNGTEPTPSPYR